MQTLSATFFHQVSEAKTLQWIGKKSQAFNCENKSVFSSFVKNYSRKIYGVESVQVHCSQPATFQLLLTIEWALATSYGRTRRRWRKVSGKILSFKFQLENLNNEKIKNVLFCAVLTSLRHPRLHQIEFKREIPKQTGKSKLQNSLVKREIVEFRMSKKCIFEFNLIVRDSPENSCNSFTMSRVASSHQQEIVATHFRLVMKIQILCGKPSN